MLAGVCAGLAEYFGWHTRAVRAIFALFSIGSALAPGTIVYCILWYLMPPPDPGFELDDFRVQ